MATNKFEFGGQVKFDLTHDTVTPEKLAKGITAHNKAGNLITGTMPEGCGPWKKVTVETWIPAESTSSYTFKISESKYNLLDCIIIYTKKTGEEAGIYSGHAVRRGTNALYGSAKYIKPIAIIGPTATSCNVEVTYSSPNCTFQSSASSFFVGSEYTVIKCYN